MNKKIIALLMASSMLLAVGCSLPENEEPYIEEDDGLTDSGIEYAENEKVFKATVTKYDSKKYLEVEIIESNIAFGTPLPKTSSSVVVWTSFFVQISLIAYWSSINNRSVAASHTSISECEASSSGVTTLPFLCAEQ